MWKMPKSGTCAAKMSLGGTNTVWKPGKKRGDPYVAEEVSNGKIRPVTYIRTYHGPKQSRGTTKPE